MAWREVALGEVLREVKRPVTVDPGVEYAEIGIRSHGKGIFHKEPVLGYELGSKKVFRVESGDLVLNIVFAWEGAVAIAGDAEQGRVGSHRFPTFRAEGDALDLRFLLYYLRTRRGLAMLRRVSPGGAGRNRTLNRTRFLASSVRLPTLSEQQNIVARLETLLRDAEEASELRASTSHLWDRLRESLVLPHPTRPVGELVRQRTDSEVVLPAEVYRFAGVRSFGRGLFQSEAKLGTEFGYGQLMRLRARNFVYPKLMAWEGAFGMVPPSLDGRWVSPEFQVFEVDDSIVLPEAPCGRVVAA